MEELKEGWKRVKLGDISEFISGYAFKGGLFNQEGYSVIKIKNVNGKFVDTTSTEKYPQELCEKLDKYKVRNNDILIAMTGAGSVGRVSKFRYNGDKFFYINQRVGKILINSQKASNEFIFQIISTPKYEKILFDMANGSGQPNLSPMTILELEINLPPLETQQKIASILSSLDDKIELNNEMNKTLEEMASTLFKRWFIDFEFPNENGEPYRSSGGKMIESELGDIPEGWEAKELGEVLKFVKGKKPKITSEIYSEDTPMKYLTIKGFSGDENLFASIEKIILVERHDIVMVMDGASSGTIYVGKNGVLGSTFSKIERKMKLEWSYIYSVLKYFENSIKEHTTGSAIPHTDKSYVEKLKVTIPKDVDFLNKLAQTANDIIEKNIQQQEEIISLTKIRDTLLPKLMSGEVVV